MKTVDNKFAPWKIILGGTLISLTIAAIYFAFRPSLTKTAKRGLNCVMVGDGNCVYELASAEERLAYGMPKDAYSRVLKEVVLPNLKSAGRSTEVQDAGNGITLATHEMLTSDGKRVVFGSSATQMKEGIRSPVLIGMAVLSAAMSEKELGSGGLLKLRNQRIFILKNRAKLEEIGMKGIYRNPDEGLMTWDQFLDRCEKGIERATEPKSSK